MNKRKMLIPVLLLALIGTGLWFRHRARANETDGLLASGTVEITEADLGFPAAGRIDRLNVREGDTVRTGQVLATLDTVELSARLAQARSEAAAMRAGELELVNGTRPEELEQARAEEEAATRTVADATADLRRMRELEQASAVSRQQVEKAELALQLAQSRLTQATAQHQLLEAGPRKERIAAQRAQVGAASAQVEALQAALANHVLRASFPGLVSLRQREPGEAVSPGQPVVSVMNPDDRWVRIYIPENRIGEVRLGAEADIRSDTYPDKRYLGRVVFIAHEAEFTPRNVQTNEERVKLVYAVKVQVVGDSAFELKPGLPVDVELHPAAPAIGTGGR